MIAPSRIINNIRAWKLLFVNAAQRMSQFIEGIAAPTFGDFGDGVRSGPCSLGDESGRDFYTTLISAQIKDSSLSCNLVVNAETKFQSIAAF
jgi:hypothetical protein